MISEGKGLKLTVQAGRESSAFTRIKGRKTEVRREAPPDNAGTTVPQETDCPCLTCTPESGKLATSTRRRFLDNPPPCIKTRKLKHLPKPKDLPRCMYTDVGTPERTLTAVLEGWYYYDGWGNVCLHCEDKPNHPQHAHLTMAGTEKPRLW